MRSILLVTLALVCTSSSVFSGEQIFPHRLFAAAEGDTPKARELAIAIRESVLVILATDKRFDCLSRDERAALRVQEKERNESVLTLGADLVVTAKVTEGPQLAKLRLEWRELDRVIVKNTDLTLVDEVPIKLGREVQRLLNLATVLTYTITVPRFTDCV